MSVNFRPLHDRIIAQRLDDEQKTASGLIIPDSAKEKPHEAKVLAVGSGKILEDGTRVPLEVAEGNRILFGKYSGAEVKIDGQDYLILREDEILAIID